MDNRLLVGYFSIKMCSSAHVTILRMLFINRKHQSTHTHTHTFLDGFIFAWKLFDDWLDKDIHREWKSGENRDNFSTPY